MTLNSNHKIQLFCIPFAGGSAMLYLSWKRYLHNSIQLYPLERAGRGSKMDIPFHKSIVEEAESAFYDIRKNLNGIPYALFGHSMGVIVIYELMKKISDNKIQKPVHIFLSGGNPIHLETNKNRHILPDDDFITELSKIGGIPDEIFKDEETRKLFLPILRADIRNCETYNFSNYNHKWNVDISVFNGVNDMEVDISNRNEWGRYTTGRSGFYTFAGGHFFINERITEVVNSINDILIKQLK